MQKWSKEEIELLLKYVEYVKSYEEIGEILNRSSDSVRGKINNLGRKISLFKIKKIKNCLECNEIITDNKKFCSHSCSASFNNKLKITGENKKCLSCNKDIAKRKKYCNNKCQCEYERMEIFNKIEEGNIDLHEANYKKYLIKKYNEKCMNCGWCEIHPVTGKVPIQLEHIDGNSYNNKLENLKLLCPNCHSLTETFGALNKGNGRKNRKR